MLERIDAKKIVKLVDTYVNGDLKLSSQINKIKIILNSKEFRQYIARNGKIIVTKKGLIRLLNQFIDNKVTIQQLNKLSYFVLAFGDDILSYERSNEELDDSITEVMEEFDYLDEFDKEGKPLNGEFTKERAEKLINYLKKDGWIKLFNEHIKIKFNNLYGENEK